MATDRPTETARGRIEKLIKNLRADQYLSAIGELGSEGAFYAVQGDVDALRDEALRLADENKRLRQLNESYEKNE